MSLVGAEFVDRINFYSNVWWPARSLVADAIEKRFETWEGGKIISFDNGGCPWKEHFFELEKDLNIEGDILFCLVEAETNKEWSVPAVPVEDQSFVTHLPLFNEAILSMKVLWWWSYLCMLGSKTPPTSTTISHVFKTSGSRVRMIVASLYSGKIFSIEHANTSSQ